MNWNEEDRIKQDNIAMTTPSATISVLIRNISFHCTELDIFTLFASLGFPLQRVIIKRSDNKKKSLLYAFVQVANYELALALRRDCDGMKFKGRRMRYRHLAMKI